VKPKVEGNQLVLGSRRVPLDASGRTGTRYHGVRLYKKIKSYEVLRAFALLADGKPMPTELASAIRGKYVFVSATAAALRDVRVSPVSQVHLGAEINAQALDNLESGSFVTRLPPWIDALATAPLTPTPAPTPT